MSSFASLPAQERSLYFEKAAALKNLPQIMIEKDFWVCWILQRLYAIADLRLNLTFKGGTSLSKVYGLIKRFSEDIDISIEQSYFGFTDDKDPKKITSASKRRQLLEDLSAACSEYVQTELLDKLRKDFQRLLSPEDKWSLEPDPDDQARQTLLFNYPTISTPLKTSYFTPAVKIEVGARAEHWPVSDESVTSYLKEALPDQVDEGEIKVRVLHAERTFWEKATILHMYAHYPTSKPLPVRQSRHYYDFYCLLNSRFKEIALNNVELLERVARHKEICFKSAWARYNIARKGTLKLIPQPPVLATMEKDFKDMGEMFFEAPPTWSTIIDQVEKFEKWFNK